VSKNKAWVSENSMSSFENFKYASENSYSTSTGNSQNLWFIAVLWRTVRTYDP